MDYDKIKIKYHREIYVVSGKVWIGGEIIRYFHAKNGEKQLGNTGFTEKEIDKYLRQGFLEIKNI